MKKILCFILLLATIVSCKKTEKEQSSKANLMTDQKMIAYLDNNKADFDSLKNWIIEDKKIQFMLSYSPDDRYLNSITQERADVYFALMNKLSIEVLSRGDYRNALLFYFSDIKEDEKRISKGYVYKIDPNKDKEEFIVFRPNGEDKNALFVKTEGDLLSEAQKLELGTFVYKPIDEHWSIICIIQ